MHIFLFIYFFFYTSAIWSVRFVATAVGPRSVRRLFPAASVPFGGVKDVEAVQSGQT